VRKPYQHVEIIYLEIPLLPDCCFQNKVLPCVTAKCAWEEYRTCGGNVETMAVSEM
jgi:hypothetical protein